MKKLSLLHYIKTDKAEYFVYNIDNDPKVNMVCIGVERRSDGFFGKVTTRILKNEIFDESWGLMGGDSFTSFVMSCINHVRSYIKEKSESIIEDLKTDQK